MRLFARRAKSRILRTGHVGKFSVSSSQDAAFRAPRVGRGLAVGDYDNDGWLDLLVSNNGENGQLYRNAGGSEPTAQKNHWLGVRLIGTKGNRDGIGSALKLTAGDFASYDQAKGGMSYCSAQDPRIHFGLGEHVKVDTLEITWPSGAREVIKNVPADQYVTIEEGKGLNSYKFPAIRKRR